MTALSFSRPDAEPDAPARWEKPPLGGWRPAPPLSAPRAATFDAIADTLIPPEGGFPVPSTVGVRAFAERYVAPEGQPATWYPFLSADELHRRLDALDGLAEADEAKRIRVLRGVEAETPAFFAAVRDLVYQGYYSCPEVVRAINEHLPAGRDYRITPQPYGYAEVIDDWDDDLLSRVRGTYTATEDIVRLDLPADLAGPDEKAATQREDA